VAQDAGTYVGEVITAKIGGARFFVVSQRRMSPDGSFNGIVAVSVFPDHFRDYYARLSQGLADSLSLIRSDGAFLARYPSGEGAPGRLGPDNSFVPAIARQPDAGHFKRASVVDGIEREFGYRKLPGYPVYVQSGIETAAIWRELGATMAGHLVFGAPATLLLFALSLYTLRGTENFYRELGRREAAEAALKQAQRLEAVGQLTGGVAHDFNNLLMVVAGNVERLRRLPTDERQVRSLDAIDTAAKRGASLVRQLLSFSRKQTHEASVVSLEKHLPELEDMLRSSLRGDIVIALELHGAPWPIKVDVSEFELAVLNIAVNARDAMPNGGRLAIGVQNVTFSDARTIGVAGEFVAVALTDTGSGMPPEVVQRVFEPFFTTKEVGKGTGLGLSQVYGFARQSGGTATVTSMPGRGTTITLYLPRTTEPVQGDQVAQPLRRDGRGRILVVEDNPEVADVTVASLADLGYEVAQASDAAAALAATERQTFDLVFSDIVMPGAMNGLDLARTLRAQRPGLPVLLVTGYSEVAQAAADEAIPILRKPYDSAALRAAIRGRLRVVA
jgi:two-component system NtrC family sensor kinase